MALSVHTSYWLWIQTTCPWTQNWIRSVVSLVSSAISGERDLPPYSGWCKPWVSSTSHGPNFALPSGCRRVPPGLSQQNTNSYTRRVRAHVSFQKCITILCLLKYTCVLETQILHQSHPSFKLYSFYAFKNEIPMWKRCIHLPNPL